MNFFSARRLALSQGGQSILHTTVVRTECHANIRPPLTANPREEECAEHTVCIPRRPPTPRVLHRMEA